MFSVNSLYKKFKSLKEKFENSFLSILFNLYFLLKKRNLIKNKNPIKNPNKNHIKNKIKKRSIKIKS